MGDGSRVATRTLASLLPPHLVRRLARGTPPVPSEERLDAALLFADVAGFTALTERLQARGPEGAEEVAALINQAFRPAIRAIDRRGGSIQSFGGDALFAVFPGAAGARRATLAAREIAASFLERRRVKTSAGAIEIRVSQVVHQGTVRAVHVGDDAWRHHILCGPAVSELARLASRAPAGSLVLSRAASRACALRARPAGAAKPPSVGAELLSRYVTPQVRELLGRFDGELRAAAIAFFETRAGSLARLQRFWRTLSGLLACHDGTLIGSDLSPHGIKWLCAFGIPATHEDDADRACAVASGLLRAGFGRNLRAGIHAGRLVDLWIGGGTRRSFQVMGDVVNTAARACALSPWGEVALTGEARDGIRRFETAARGRHAAKGKRAPVELHALGAERPLPRRAGVFAPLCGRVREMGVLSRAVAELRDGRGAVLGIRGEAGIGKSRLAWEAGRLASPLPVREGRAPAVGIAPYGPLVEILCGAAGIAPGDPRAERRMRAFARQLGLSAPDADLLAGLRGGPGHPAAEVDAGARRLDEQLAIRAMADAIGRRGPELWILEDLQHADAGTVEAIAVLARGAAVRGILVLLLYRGGVTPPSGEIALHELDAAAAGAMLEGILGDAAPAAAPFVVERAAGVPLFVEELVRHLLDTGCLSRAAAGFALERPPEREEVPPGLAALIAARLDHLSAPARRIVQIGSAIGRVFPVALLDRVAGRACDVAELVEREIVALHGGDAREMIFKHALARDVAYGTILPSRRRALHRAIASELEASKGDGLSRLAVIAHHWDEAGLATRARAAYRHAGDAARGAYAYEEAERLFLAALSFPGGLRRLELETRLALAGVKASLGRRDALETYGAAARLAARLRRPADRVLALLGVARHERLAGRPAAGIETSEVALALARDAGDALGTARALRELAVLLDESGRTAEAQEHLEEALRIHREAGHEIEVGRTLGQLAVLYRERGQGKKALRLYDEALAIARRTGNVRSEASHLANKAVVHRIEGRIAEARAAYEEALKLARRTADRRAEVAILVNVAGLEQSVGHDALAEETYREVLDRAGAAGDRRMAAVAQANLAGLAMDRGAMHDALTLTARSLEILREIGERRLLAQVLTSQGRMQAAMKRFDAARADLLEAIASAALVADPHTRGIALLDLARVHREMRDLSSAASCISDAEELLSTVNDSAQLVACACEQGRLALAHGETALARAALEQARRRAGSMPAVDASRAIEALQGALDDRARGVAGC